MTNPADRSQPCPCGSGRKYKNCCYRRDAEASGGRERKYPDPDWFLMRKTEGEIVEAVASFLRAHCGADARDRAWDEFRAGSPIADELLAQSIFIPWLVFNWRPPRRRGPAPEPPALAYLAENEARLDDYQKSFIRAACSEPFTFFAVTAVEPRRSLTLRDMLLEREVTVKERQASATLRRGHVLYARCVTLAGQSILLGVAPVPLPPEAQYWVLDVRENLRKFSRLAGPLDRERLRADDAPMRSFYFEAAGRVLNPPPPVLQNTDGDPLAIVRLKYGLLCPPEQALEALRSLSLPEFQEGVSEGAEFDRSGRLKRATVTWQKRGNRLHPEWDNTSLGSIDIRNDVIEIEVNSEKRATKIRAEIRERLGGRCTFVSEQRQFPDELLREAEGGGGFDNKSRRGRREVEGVPPEFRAALRDQMKAHWESWLDTPIPALNGRTPRAAARTPKDRERLEVLLMELEFRNESIIQPELRPDVTELRRKLGLA